VSEIEAPVPEEIKKFYQKIPRPRLATVLTVLIASAWLAANLAAYATRNEANPFEAPSSLDPLMLLVAGAYFTNMAVVDRKAENKKEES
jgi:hypothetical protein